MNRKQRINVVCAVALGVVIFVMLVVAYTNPGRSSGYKQYSDARLKLAAAKSGTVEMQIFVTNTLTGSSSFYLRESSYSEKRGIVTSLSRASAVMGNRQYYHCAFFDSEQFYLSTGGGWYVHPKEYYINFYSDDPFYDIGPPIDREHIRTIEKVDNSDVVEYTFVMHADNPVVSYPLLFFTQSTFIERSAAVTLDKAGQFVSLHRFGALTVREGFLTDQYDVEIVYRMRDIGMPVEIERPDGV